MPRDPQQAIGFLLGFALALWLSPLRIEATGPGVPDPAFAPLEQDLFAQVNRTREQHHRAPLRPERPGVVQASRAAADRGREEREVVRGNGWTRIVVAAIDGRAKIDWLAKWLVQGGPRTHPQIPTALSAWTFRVKVQS